MDAKRLMVGIGAALPAALIAWLALPSHVSELARGLPQWPILLGIDAGLVGGIILVLAGFAGNRSSPAFAGAGLLLVAALPLMLGATGFVVLASVALVVLGARLLAPPSRAVGWIVRGIATLVVAAYAALVVASARAGGIVFTPIDAAFAITIALFLAASWWPWSRAAAQP